MSRSDSQAWRDLCDKIEALMDAHHIESVLLATSEVLRNKADHLTVNWQDYSGAEQLGNAASYVDRAAEAAK